MLRAFYQPKRVIPLENICVDLSVLILFAPNFLREAVLFNVLKVFFLLKLLFFIETGNKNFLLFLERLAILEFLRIDNICEYTGRMFEKPVKLKYEA